MTKIVDLQAFREKALEQRSFTAWQKRFGESYGTHTRLSDLSDKTLFALAQPGLEPVLRGPRRHRCRFARLPADRCRRAPPEWPAPG